MQLTNDQFALIKQQFATLKERSAFYAAKFEGIDLSDVQTQEDFEKLPFSEKDDLRNAYPLGLQAVPDEEIVRIHSSSGTTGTPVIIPYTQQDVTDWAIQFARCYETAGITNRDRICLRKGVIGSERWGDKMRQRIAGELGVEIYDIYGLTEVYGPGIGISCDEHHGMHIWDDYVYVEVVDPDTGAPVPDGEVGELVLTTLRKQGAPLIRYRTHDLTRIIPGDCKCGFGHRHPRIDTLTGRTDDMFKVKGCNIFPAQVEEVIAATDGTSSEYQVMIENISGKDVLTVLFETPLQDEAKARAEEELALIFKAKCGCTPDAKGVPMGELPRSEKKTKRIFDSRY